MIEDEYFEELDGEDRLIVSTKTDMDEIENILRPKSMEGYVGQTKVKENLAVYFSLSYR